MVDEYDSECEICKVFSNPGRLKILVALGEKKLSVGDIEKKTGLSQSVVSQQLSMMKIRGILEMEKEGSFVYYKVKYPELLEVLDLMKKVRRKIKNGR
jgi:DNA-binding transcriptional ArsR family regulator